MIKTYPFTKTVSRKEKIIIKKKSHVNVDRLNASRNVQFIYSVKSSAKRKKKLKKYIIPAHGTQSELVNTFL